ncbi:MAG: response regulator transcription factor [Caldilineaceae bacterium]|nr:response regulator transcription factor [Caldilineaceae bacterium]
MIRLLLVQPTRMTCELFAAVLREEPDLQVVDFAHSVSEVVDKLRRHKCDVVLVDFNLPDKGMLSCMHHIHQNENDVKVIITGMVKSSNVVLHCVEEGIAGYVYHEESLGDLVKKIRAVYDDEFMLCPQVAATLMARVAELKQMTKELYGIRAEHIDDMFAELTPREWEVLQLVERGLSNDAIAKDLVIETGTVKNHVHNILSKLDVHCREQAAILARQLHVSNTNGLTSDPNHSGAKLPHLNKLETLQIEHQHAQKTIPS